MAQAMNPEQILVVEDDDGVREYAGMVLRDAGYAVLTARDAVEAFILLEQNPDIPLLFTDIVMPRIDGLMLADMAKLRHPALRVLYATGFSDRVARQPGYRYGPLLEKPYRGAQLEAAVRDSLAQPPNPLTPCR